MTKITISGTPGSGKSVIADSLCEVYNLKYYDLGKLMRKAAEDRNLKLEELQELRKTDDSIDIELDNKTKNIGETENDFIFVGRLAYHFIPDSIKIYLKCDIETGAKRILEHKDESRNVEKLNDLKEAIQKLKERQNKDKELYKKIYNLEPFNEDNYDLVLDTTSLTITEMFDKLVEYINKKEE